jgi:hypothetical protein
VCTVNICYICLFSEHTYERECAHDARFLCAHSLYHCKCTEQVDVIHCAHARRCLNTEAHPCDFAAVTARKSGHFWVRSHQVHLCCSRSSPASRSCWPLADPMRMEESSMSTLPIAIPKEQSRLHCNRLIRTQSCTNRRNNTWIFASTG